MRADLSTIQQTLTPEAASVLNQSISEAARRNHGQTTPLHVAATLLSSPTSFLRQACIKSHPNSSHPLQCRALELCFSVALERLPTASAAGSGLAPASSEASFEPPISNALMAALKRAQAHQRRGCPEQQQQPLLAVKVELEQLIISILDDPSVSRVMREAKFSSPAVKAAVERSLSNSSPSISSAAINPSPIGFGLRPGPTPVNRNVYLNPRLEQNGIAQTRQQRSDEVMRVIDILVRTKKRNPVLVGESEPQTLVKEILGKVENRELSDGPLRNSVVICLENELGSDNTQMATKVEKLPGLIETRLGNSDLGGVILYLGDLKWLVEDHPVDGVTVAVAEMRKLLERYGERLWLIGTATCETYLRCQVYHPSMENDWDLQAVPIAAKSPFRGMFPRLRNDGMLLSNPAEPIAPMRSFPVTSTAPPSHVYGSSQFMQNYQNDLAKLEKSNSEARSEPARRQLPQWLQNAKAGAADAKTVDKTPDQELLGLQKKWNETCLNLHHSYHHQPTLLSAERIVPTPVSLTSLCGLIPRQPSHPKLQANRSLSDTLQPSPDSACSPPGSPVWTDLVLGQPKKTQSTPAKPQEEHVKDFLRNKSDILKDDKLGDSLDRDSFKMLLKGLTERVWWQHDAASAVAGTVSQCKLGNGRQRGVSSKGDVWLLFTGPDRIGKKKMASALSELIGRANPITINLGSRRDNGNTDLSFRGKTALDRIAESVKRNPFSVIVLEDIDYADTLLRGNIKRAMERGRICDSHGREISLGNVIFILTANWSPGSKEFLSKSFTPIKENKLLGLVSGGWQLRLSVCEKTSKRRPSWLYDDGEERTRRPRKEISSGLSLDLNEAADVDDDKANGLAPNSSYLTINHDQDDIGLSNKLLSHTLPSLYRDLVSFVDDAILFRAVDFGPIKRNTEESMKKLFSSIIGDKLELELKEDALEKIAGGIWLSQIGKEEWIEKVMVPSLHQLKSQLPSIVQSEQVLVRLEIYEDSVDRSREDFLPSSIKVVIDPSSEYGENL